MKVKGGLPELKRYKWGPDHGDGETSRGWAGSTKNKHVGKYQREACYFVCSRLSGPEADVWGHTTLEQATRAGKAGIGDPC